MGHRQLFKIIPEMTLVHYFNIVEGDVNFREADEMPFLRWPNGTPCLIANAYMIELLKRNLSRRNKGGTLRQFAKDISHLIRFCFDCGLDFTQLNSDRFTHFISNLRSEKDPLHPGKRRRDSNTLTGIGKKCLDFLDFVGRLNGAESFVVDTIDARKKVFQVRAGKRQARQSARFGWHHHSFDTPGPSKSRGPITKKSIQALYDAIPRLSAKDLAAHDKRFIDRRRTVMIRLLEMTGARIDEIAQILVRDIEEASQQPRPMLRLVTLKKRRPDVRFIPVMHQDLAILRTYIRISRPRLIKQTIGETNDHGFLFVSQRTGQPLSSKYMSNEVGLLRRTAGINSQVCAHMFRNRFITKLFVQLINQFNLTNKDEFRKALLDVNALKQQVQQYTGHSSANSLDPYIDWAFNEVTDLTMVLNSVHLQDAFGSFDFNLELLHTELEDGLPVAEYLEKYRQLRELRHADIERLVTTENEAI